MEAIINLQKDIQRSIERALINFKKCPKERCTAEYIEAKLDNLEKDWILFRKNNGRLYESYQSSILEDSIYVKNEIYENTEESYIVARSQFKSKQKSSPIVTSANESRSSSLAKLPKITIPTFSGRYEEWTTFKDLFVSLVHHNKSLDNVQRLHYLKGYLAGEAELLIRHTPIAESNYDRCWELLESRYSNKRFLSNAILNKLFSQRSMKFESATAIKELIDTTSDCLSALKALEVDVSTWDIIIIHIVGSKLDPETRKQWELSVFNVPSSEIGGKNELPTFTQFKSFLENRFRALEFVEPSKRPAVAQHGSGSQTSSRSFVATSDTMPCEFCSEGHKLSFCKAFAKQDVSDRRAFVVKNRMCFNCLGGNHNVYSCKKFTVCRFCKRRHHTLLHLTSEEYNATQQGQTAPKSKVDSDTPSTSSQVVSCLSTDEVPKTKQVLLATALIKAESVTGEYQTVRALMDQGSQACFITEAAVQLLRLKKVPAKGTISGLGNDSNIKAKYLVQTTIQSRTDPEFKMEVQAYVLGHITSYLPEKHIERLDWVEIETVQLADPQFATPRKIDMLLGADVYSQVLKQGIKKGSSGKLVAQSTSLGWILSGVVTPANSTHQKLSVMYVTCNENENELLKRFWEIEEANSTKRLLTDEEQKCETFYKDTTKKEAGRYVVKLPFKDEKQQCKYGHSRDIAVKRLMSLEKRLSRDTQLKEQYTDVIHEYLSSNHMRPVKENDGRKNEAVYLPHHPVVRNDKETTKVRVVYDASCSNSKGVSLNDTLMVGPTLQADLRHTILRWRTHNIALVADIIKMYRQVRVDEEDVIYQRIVWRDDPGKEIQDYELMTVTFGTASAPYLAVRTMHQVAYDEREAYPLAADKVLNCFYMDDLMTGCSTIEEGVHLYKQIVGLLDKGGFKLQKWNSNNQELLKQINEYENTDKYKIEDKKIKKVDQTGDNDRTNYEDNIEMKLDTTIKILGLTWNRREDVFQYTVQLPPLSGSVTKRKIISDIARIFDPLRWIAPAVVVAKMMIQKLWLSGIGWDEAVPAELLDEWNTYRAELPQLTAVKIPRWLGIRTGDADVEIHGFCDASKLAYAAVVYLRVLRSNGDIQTTLLVARTRVAPIKQISIPRLELCGAVLLAKLISEVIEVVGIPKEKVRAWTDSTIVLAWLNSHPSKWKTFVANRVSEILTTLDSSHWWHVVSQDNPADCASRGVLPSLLAENDLWLSGPQFLRDLVIHYSRPMEKMKIQLEENVKAHVATAPESTIVQRFSSLPRLLRVIAYCRRFLKGNKGHTKYVQKKEIDEALECCIKNAQEEEFIEERRQLQANGGLKSKTSKLKSLCPYLDEQGIMRVSGRIQQSQLSEQIKHPIILPHESHLSKLIVKDAHQNTLHGGAQLMENYLRSGFWILGVKSLVKQHIRKCVTCIRQNAAVKTQYMGSLPAVRCTPARAFKHSGVDYAGPIQIRTSKGRGNHSYKGYICLFVCMVTRAIHLELVSDMSTSTFLSAFRRFVSRRGHCSQIWSDNGTTFVGASKELAQLSTIQQESAVKLETNGTQWHFIPPRAPNFGGLWEAGVKSTKFHLKRVIGDSTLTFEEMSTLLSQVEACLNSRPLTVINSTEPGEPLPLTPGHFLIGEPLVSLPGIDYESSIISSLSRWQLVQKMFQGFWRRWSQDYLTSLVHRYKWTDQVPEPRVDDVVLIKEDDQPPGRWLLGRVVEKHQGPDGLTRVVTLKTNKNVIKRPTSKLCVLPVE